MATEIEAHADELLERLYECSTADEDTEAAVAAFVEEQGRQTSYGYALIDLLDGAALVKKANSAGGADGRITAAGIREVQQRRAARKDPKVRGEKLRGAMLLWLHQQEEDNRSPSSWDSFVELASTEAGGGYSEREVEHAAEFLDEHRLINSVQSAGSVAGMHLPGLSVPGRTCVTDFRGDVNEYLNRGQARPSVTTSTTTNNYVSDNHGNLSIAGENFSQVSNAGLDVTDILELAGGVNQLASVLQLPPDHEQEIVQTAEQLHAEASAATPDRGKLHQLVDKIVQGVKEATPTVARKTLLTLGEHAFRALAGG